MKTKRFPILWKKEKKGTVLVELSDRLLKVIQVAGEGSARKIVSLDALEIDSHEEEKFSKQLSVLLKRLPRRVGEIFASLPRSQITTRVFQLPSTQPLELAKMVEFQIEKEIPFPKEKIIFDFHPIETTPEGYTKVLLVIAGEEVVRRYLTLLKKGGVGPSALFFSSQGLASWFTMTQGEKEKESFAALIDVDLFLTHVEILHRGELHFTRSLPIGARQIDEKGSSVQETFLQELTRTFAAFKKELPPGRIDKVFLSGASKILPLVQDLIRSQVTSPLEIIDFKSHCPLDARFVKEGIGEEISFSSGAGFLLRDEKRVNLIPPAEKRARRDRLFRRALAQFIILCASSLFLLGFIFGSTLHHRRAALLSLRTELHQLEPTAIEIESMQKELEFLKIREEESELPLELLRELYRTVPQEAALTYLVIEPDHISLRGGSRNLSTVFTFAKALESSPLFKSVRVKNATRRTLSEGEMTLFQIDASVVPKKEKKR